MKYLNFSLCTWFAVTCVSVHVTTTTANFTQEDLIVEAGVLGKIQGMVVNTTGTSSRSYLSFVGIPYAKPVTPDRRFLPSELAKEELVPGGGIFSATNTSSPACIQPPSLYNQSEDCLTINVNTPKIGNGSDLLPVIFFIHGGAFTVGRGITHNGNFLLNRDIVLVTFNYRLGVLGFFSLNTEKVPGNAAMYDIINALKWTKEFITYFGGNPNKITIAGQSAGSVAVTHLLAIPEAAGMIHGAIGASGSALAAWGTKDDSNDITDSLFIANFTGCYNYSWGHPNAVMIENITECMQNVLPEVLVAALFTFQVTERFQGRLGFSAISPVVQNFNASENFTKILTEHPKQVFESGRQAKVPLMMGSTRHDGSYVLGIYYNRFLKGNNYVNETDSDRDFMTKKAVPRILETLGIPNEYGIYDSIAKMYLGDTRKSGNFWEMYPGFIDLFSVFFFKASSYQTALYHVNRDNPTFWYSFDYAGRHSLFNFLYGTEPPPFRGGITHSDDTIYLFDMWPLFTLDQEEERVVSDRMVDYWVNFATFGNPTPDNSSIPRWHALTEDDAKFVSIGKVSQEQKHYDDAWSGIGWEVVPLEPTTTEISSPTPTSPGTGGSSGMLSSYTSLTILLLFINALYN